MDILEPEVDVLSVTASAPEDVASHPSVAVSCASPYSSAGASEDNSMAAIIRMALTRLQLDPSQVQPAPARAFFRRGPAPSNFTVPPSKDYLLLHGSWRDSRAFSHLTSDTRPLAAMQDAPRFGFGRMPAIEPTIAALIVTPDEALRPDDRCPRPQCRVTDDLLSKAYDATVGMGCIGNSLSHLLLTQSATVDSSIHSFSNASLQAFALMFMELGRLMSTLVQACRQVWLAQSPLTEACRRILRSVPVEPGELFGSAALEMVQCTFQARQTRQQLSGLNRSVNPSGRPRGSSAAPQCHSCPQVSASGYLRAQHSLAQPAQQLAQAFRTSEQLPSAQP